MSPDPRPLILHVIHHLVIGGMENGLVNLINRMPASKYRHAVACIEDYSEFRERISRPDVEVYALHRSRIGIWRLRRELFHLCRRLRPTIVHTRNQSGLDALLPARLAGVPHCIHGEHGWDIDNLDGRKLKPILLRKLHSPLIERYITVSKDLERFLTERVGVADRRISQIYNGVDIERFVPRQPAAAAAGAEPLIWIGTVGRIQPVKDQATLLRAFALLLASRPELRLRLRVAIVGNGPLLDELRRLAATLKIEALTWFPGANEQVPQVLQGFDVFVLPSLNEGISNTILEAMAAGLPVLASAVGGNPELIEANLFGRLFQPGDTAALCGLLGDYALDEPLRRAHGQAARRVAVERFSLDAMVKNYEAVYDRTAAAV